MSWKELHARWLNATAQIKCPSCNHTIGRSSSVIHAIKIGGWYLPYCEACHSELVARYLQHESLIEEDAVSARSSDPLVHGRCAKCKKVGDPYKMSDPLTDEVLLVRFWRPKRAAGDEHHLSFHGPPQAPVKVWAGLNLCLTCIHVLFPRFSVEWGTPARRYWHLAHRHIPM
jgi:predicted RNA-binding Zn-ribbon protein involved in translation (DUF1610 family)